MNVEGTFKDWKLGEHRAEHLEAGHSLWIANGFMSFSDYGAVAPFLAGMPLGLKWKLWRELKLERRDRAMRRVERMTR